MRLHACEPYACFLCQKPSSNMTSLSCHMRTHKSQSGLEYHDNESQHSQEILSRSDFSTTVDKGGEDEGVPISRSEVDEKKVSELHTFESPYIINMKIEENV